MAIKTSSKAPGCRSEREANREGIIFMPGDGIDAGCDTLLSQVITVRDTPIHIFANLPVCHQVSVKRVYSGRAECVDVPDLPVLCDECNQLMLYHYDDATGIKNDIWLTARGQYIFEYETCDSLPAPTEIPDDVYVWYIEDDSIFKDPCCSACHG